MPSPPLSPTPRRWRSPDNPDPHPDFAALLQTFEQQPDHLEHPRHEPIVSPSEEIGFPGWRKDDDNDKSTLTAAPTSPEKVTSSPQGIAASTSSAPSPHGKLSPLPGPPNRSQMFGDASSTAGKMVGLGISSSSPGKYLLQKVVHTTDTQLALLLPVQFDPKPLGNRPRPLTQPMKVYSASSMYLPISRCRHSPPLHLQQLPPPLIRGQWASALPTLRA